MNIKNEARAAVGFVLLLAVCLFTEPIVDRMTAQAVQVEPDVSVVSEQNSTEQSVSVISDQNSTEQRVSVEIERIELPSDEQDEAEQAEQFRNDTPLTDEEYRVLLETCERCRIDPSLALGLIEVESHFNKDAVSRCGARGYMQLLPKYFGVLSPTENIQRGIEYLAEQCERYGNVESGLTSYNAGHDTGDNSYARAVLSAAEKWSR